MKATTPMPAATPGVKEADREVAQCRDELASIRAGIAVAEAGLPKLALDPDDSKYEEASNALDRLKRSELRAKARLKQAQEAVTEAKAREAEERRATLYEAGRQAMAEVERLTAEYGKRAAGVAEVLREIGKHEETIRVANENLLNYSQRIDLRGIYLGGSVVLPSASEAGEYIWSSGEPTPRPPKSPRYVTVDGTLVMFDESNPDHVAARAAENAMPAILPRPHQPAPQDAPKYGEKSQPDGSRKITLPPNQWPPLPEPKAQNEGRRRLPTDGLN